eukprot:Gregarina_sp_Poly_1__141@NODE_1031_length_5291_cov_107_018185_g716_i0_p3_GENE_NODE_1031_length_5291_cov_107_018185_g716_i0NODE_1031_length_5291_cov_107_018185_g716_i0_p3_ORF_typecomplete_len202_score31_58DOT1/PF08123_13/5_5e12PrmA/PF06325_13/4_6e09Methyltransf_31/PF13847_6/2_1e08Methyltransf_25/PF13649_6/3_9e06MTS/PF05175_14/6_1e06MetW/PF07021_12/9e06Methyltransf_23/PF13489_6/2_2e05UPF0020/PF01170_18/2e05Methyltransf_18/PF12847_7/3_5e05Methyltransf_4/PF02390_17/0_00017N6_Mtase/PF02384_16/9_4e05C
MTSQALSELFPDEFEDSDLENNFPLWIEGVDTTFAPFVPTPMRLVREVLASGNTNPKDGLIDLGCGDGRFCISAVVEYGAKKAWGIDIDEQALSRANCALNVMQQNGALSNSDAVKFDAINFDCDELLENIVQDPQWTILVTVLTGDFQKARQSFVRQFLNRYHNRRWLSVFFNLNEIENVTCYKRSGKTFVYVGDSYCGA